MVELKAAASHGLPSRSRKAALVAVTTTTLLGFAPAYAQEAPSDTPTMEIQEIVVTGSRIRRSDTATAAPITVIDQQALADRGFVSVSQALNETTANSPARAQSLLDGSGSGGGEQYPALFGLGAGRTLTLVNGRRMVTSAGSFASDSGFFGSSSNDSVVDTNLIPTGLLRSVEIVQGGGAAVYGSDAMGGVVNYIYKDDFEGLELDAQYGQSDRGDNEAPSARATWGMNFSDRGNLAVNIEWSKTEALLPEDRMDATRFLTASSNDLNTGPNDGQPSLVRIRDAQFWPFNQSGVLFVPPNPGAFPNRAFITTNGLPFNAGGIPAQFNAAGTGLIAYNPGVFPTVKGPSVPFASGGDGTDYRSLTALTTGIERANANVIGHYDLTDKIRLSTELLYATTKGEDPRASIATNTVLNQASTGSGPITISSRNAFLTPEVRNAIISYMNNSPDLTTVYGLPPNSGSIWGAGAPLPVSLSKIWTDLLPSSVGEREVDTFRAVLSLDGDFSAANREFYWNVSATHANVDGSSRTWGVWQSRYNNAINSVLSNGNAVCAINADANAANDDPSCSPINPFGVGNVSEAARNYVSTRFGMDYENTQQDYLATLGGDVVYLPGGPMRFNVGFEHRKEEAEFTPLASNQAGIGRLGVPTAPQSGEYDTNEFSLELLVPILGQDFSLPGAETVELTGAFRSVDHSIAGSENVWNAGLRWTIVQDITVRGSRSRNFRAPNLTQLFAPTQVTQTTIGIDPCDADRINGGTNPAVRLANCQAVFGALGIPLAGFQDDNESFAGAQVTTSGNANLENEISDTWSYGFIFQPRLVEGLTLIVDRIEIDLEDGLSYFQPQDFLATCFDSPDMPANICGVSTRDPATGFVTTSAAQTINAGSIRYRGENYNVNYNFGVGPGNLFLGLEATHTSLLEQSVTGVDLTRTDGTTLQPDWRMRFDARYGWGALRLAYSLNYLPSVLNQFSTATIETTDVPTVDANYRHSISAQYDVTDAVTVRAGVENFTDEMPSYPTASYGDILGRQYYMGVRAKF